MKRKSRSPYSPPPRSSAPKSSLFDKLNYGALALYGGIFVLGTGVGIAFSSGQTLNTSNVASREFIDRSAPNPEVCVQYGASAIVTDMRVFITLNPFNVYVTQPSMKPGCVLRKNNWAILEQQGLIKGEQVNACKNRMNTFGFVGRLDSSPQISCIYQNEAAGNLFLDQPGSTGVPQETEKF